MSLRTEQEAFLLDYCKLIVYAYTLGFTCTAGELLRPVEMQEIYVRDGRSKTMNSYHLRKLAGDINFFKDGIYTCTVSELEPLGKYWESLNPQNRWGGNFDHDWSTVDTFKDAPHFERHVL